MKNDKFPKRRGRSTVKSIIEKWKMHHTTQIRLPSQTEQPGKQLALEYGIKFIETSAKANINVENEGNSPQGSNHGVKITPDQQKKSSFFRCVLL
ncbi:ras-related protein Rab-8A isoform X3 [Ascaphus truei]|uniref:ras-related protein Rab-8A isoform X3 n=1 Tax=Ascaphus truei TaxID=8439 RepID=UPI003F59BA89